MCRLRLFALLALPLLTLTACSDDNELQPVVEDSVDGGTVRVIQAGGTISGQVRSGHNSPLEGVNVATAGVSVATNEAGEFLLADLTPGRHVVSFESRYRQSLVRVADLRAGAEVNWWGSVWDENDDGVCLDDGSSRVFGARGGAVSGGSSSVTVEVPDSAAAWLDGRPHLDDYSALCFGQMERDNLFLQSWPGGMRGIDHGGSEVGLRTHMFVEVRFATFEGQELTLAPGRALQVSSRLWIQDLPDAPEVLSAWRLDRGTAMWHEVFDVELVDQSYVFSADTLGVWALAAPLSEICTVRGRVVDDQEQPVEGAHVLCRNQDPIWGDVVVTDADGRFTADMLALGEARLIPAFGRLEGPWEDLELEGLTELELAAPLRVPLPAFSVALSWGEEPEDLDLRLYVPMDWNPDFGAAYDLVYFGDVGHRWGSPYAELVMDDTDAFGPEIITGYRLVEGRYQVWVHHWDGDEPVAGKVSGPVTVRLAVGGEAWIFEREQAPSPGECWHVCDLESADGVASVVPVLELGAPPAADLTDKSRGAVRAPGP